jgi:O-methyltransferase involved in polyketide biosynthesis
MAVARTYLFDQFIREQLGRGVDMVVNLAAGLDARPYRMEFPPSLKWIEVDLPDLIAYKEGILANERPTCDLERVRLDVLDECSRRESFDQLGRRTNKALILTEGLLVYLTGEQVASLARDLRRIDSFQFWALDLPSPGLLRMLQRNWQGKLNEGGTALRFAPSQGPLFFAPHEWMPIDVRSVLRTAARLRRVSLWMRLLARLPESTGQQGSRPWSGVCLLARQ